MEAVWTRSSVVIDYEFKMMVDSARIEPQAQKKLCREMQHCKRLHTRGQSRVVGGSGEIRTHGPFTVV